MQHRYPTAQLDDARGSEVRLDAPDLGLLEGGHSGQDRVGAEKCIVAEGGLLGAVEACLGGLDQYEHVISPSSSAGIEGLSSSGSMYTSS